MVTIREKLTSYHDGRFDGLDEDGDIIAVDEGDDIDVVTSFEIDPDDYIENSNEKGVAVSLGERALILTKLAKLYAKQARAGGMDIANTLGKYQPDIDERYHGRGDEVVGKTVDKAKRAVDTEEDVYIARLVKKHELVEEGFDSDEIDEDTRRLKADLRAAIGASVGYATRNRVIKGIYNPETYRQPRAQRKQK